MRPMAVLNQRRAGLATLLAIFYFCVLQSTSSHETSSGYYLVCRDTNTQLCVTWLVQYSQAMKMATELSRENVSTDLCGFSELKPMGENRSYVEVNPIDETKPVIECPIKSLVVKYDKDLLNLKSIHEIHRVRRQVPYALRGRYRGQTQSQYLAIDHGNGKDEGKAEAHSAADSSRASVSGTSGMGQAQSQSMYDPTCDDCVGGSTGIDTVKQKPLGGAIPSGLPSGAISTPRNNLPFDPTGGSRLTGNGGYGPNENGERYGPGSTGINGVYTPPGTRGIYGPNQIGNGAYNPGLNGIPRISGVQGPNTGYGIGPGGGYTGTSPGLGNQYSPPSTSTIYEPVKGGYSPRQNIPDRSINGYLPVPGGSNVYGPNPNSGVVSNIPGGGYSQNGQYGPNQNGNMPYGTDQVPSQGTKSPAHGGGPSGIDTGLNWPSTGPFTRPGSQDTSNGPSSQGNTNEPHNILAPNAVYGSGGNKPYDTDGQSNYQTKPKNVYGTTDGYTPGSNGGLGYHPSQGGQGGSYPGTTSTQQGPAVPFNPADIGTNNIANKYGQLNPNNQNGLQSPGTYSPTNTGQNHLPGVTSSQNGLQGPGGQYTPTNPDGQIPGVQYNPGSRVGHNGLQIPGGLYNSGIGGGPNSFPGTPGHYQPGSIDGHNIVTGPGAEYRPGIVSGQNGLQGPGNPYGGGQSRNQEPGGQYAPGNQNTIQRPGGQYGPDGAVGQGVQEPGNLYDSRPQYGPGIVITPNGLQGPAGQYIPGPSGGQNVVSAPGGQYGGSGTQYGPGGQSGIQGPGTQYSPDDHNGIQGPGTQFGPGGQNGGQAPGTEYGPVGQNGIRGPGAQFGPGGQNGVQVPGTQYGPGGQRGIQGPGTQYGPGGQRGIQGPGIQYNPGEQNGIQSPGTKIVQEAPLGNQGPGTQYRPGGQYGNQGPGNQYGPSGQTGIQVPMTQYDNGQGGIRGPGSQYGPSGQSDLQGLGGQNGLQYPGGNYGPGVQSGLQKPGGAYGSGLNGIQNNAIPGTGDNYIPAGQGGYGISNGPFNLDGTGSQQGQYYNPSLPGQNGPYGTNMVGQGPGSINSGTADLGNTGNQNGQYGPRAGLYPNLYGNELSNTGGGSGQYGNVPYGYGNNQAGAGAPQNVVDPNSALLIDGDDSAAEASISQASNGTTAIASSKGGNDKGRAQTHVQGAYTGGGSFSAQAEISGENKAANSEVTGDKKGASSNAQGSGRNNKSQANVQLGSETGSILTGSQSEGVMHSSNTQVQGSLKGGMADAQARGPGSTSSQAQIGFTPYTHGDKSHDVQKSPFVGGGTAAAQSSGRTGSSQSQLRGTFKYGITYNGGAQAGASLDKDTVFSNRLPFDKIDVYDEKNKNINIETTEKSLDLLPTESTEIPLTTENLAYDIPSSKPLDISTNTEKIDPVYSESNDDYGPHSHSDHHKTELTASTPTLSPPVESRRSFQSAYGTNSADYEYTTDKEENQPEEYDMDDGFAPEGSETSDNDQGEFANYNEFSRDSETHQSLNSPKRKGLEVRQITGGNTQHIVLGALPHQNAEITQRNSERPDESKIYQPGERIPGTGGYTIPIGFTGSVKSVASKDKTYVVGSKDSPSQAQTVSLTPGSGKIKYTYPTTHTRNVNPKDLRSLYNVKSDDNNRYVSVSKSVTRDLDSDNNIRKQYSHTYYTKSSSCGYFTFTCNMVSGAEGKKKVCKPKIPTNPDGTPMRC